MGDRLVRVSRVSSLSSVSICVPFFFTDTATTEIYTLSLHDALPISRPERRLLASRRRHLRAARNAGRRCLGRDPEPGRLGAARRLAPLGARSARQRVLLRAPLRLYGDGASRNARESRSGARLHRRHRRRLRDAVPPPFRDPPSLAALAPL